MHISVTQDGEVVRFVLQDKTEQDLLGFVPELMFEKLRPT